MSELQRSQPIAIDLGIRPLAVHIGAQIDTCSNCSNPTSPGSKIRSAGAGTRATWDNTATQHCAINDYGDQKRVVRRSSIRGEAPVSVDGCTSVTTCKTTKPAASAQFRKSAAV